MATDPSTQVNGTTADATDNQDKFDELYQNIDSTNVAAGNKTGTGKFVLQTSPTLNTPTLTSPIFTGPISLHSGSDLNIYSDAGITLKFAVDGATGDFGMAATRKFYLDGAALTGDTYIYESAANQVSLFVGGSELLRQSTTLSRFFQNLSVDSTNELYFDGGGDTYIYESAANILDFVAGGIHQLRITSSVVQAVLTDVWIDATYHLYLDGGGDTYIYESSANVMAFVTGTAQALTLTSTSVTVGSNEDLIISAGKKLYVDSGGDTYLIEGAPNFLTMYAGGSQALTLSTTQVRIGSDQSLAVQPTKKFFLDGGSNTYIDEVSADVMRFVAGGTELMRIDSGGIYATNHSTTASGANAYIDAATGQLLRSTSSVKYKENLEDLEIDTSKIYQLRPISYDDKLRNLKEDSDKTLPHQRYFGLSAEEVDQILPQLVDHDSVTGEAEYVFYDRLSVLLLKQLKIQKERIDTLESLLILEGN